MLCCSQPWPEKHLLQQSTFSSENHNWSQCWEYVTIEWSTLNESSVSIHQYWGSGDLWNRGWRECKSWMVGSSAVKGCCPPKFTAGCGWLPERYPPSARSANIPTDSTNKLRKAGAVSTQPHGTFLARRTEIDVSCLGPKQPYLNQHCPFLGSEKTPLPPSDVSAPLN